MKTNRKFETPELSVMEFDCEDIITTSGGLTDGGSDGTVEKEDPDAGNVSGGGSGIFS